MTQKMQILSDTQEIGWEDSQKAILRGPGNKIPPFSKATHAKGLPDTKHVARGRAYNTV